MIDDGKARDVVGSAVYAANHRRLGRVEAVYLDDCSGAPEFAVVHIEGGAEHGRESLVPLRGAEVADGELTVPYGPEQVGDAPHVEVDDGHLSPAEEEALYRYYGLLQGRHERGPAESRAPLAADPALTEGRTLGAVTTGPASPEEDGF